MAKALSDDYEIIRAKVTENVSSALSDYSSQLESAPTYCIYYNRNMAASTQDKTLDASYKHLGVGSPVRFNTIEKFPLFKLEQLVLDLSQGTFGEEADISTSATILPGTIIPFVDDYVRIPFSTGSEMTDALFRVTNVSKSVLNSRRFYKLTISYVPEEPAQLAEQVVEELVMNVTDYEENRTPILKKSDAELLSNIRLERARLSQAYLDKFFWKEGSSLRLIVDGDWVVCFPLHNFVEELGCFEFDRTFYSSAEAFYSPYGPGSEVVSDFLLSIPHSVQLGGEKADVSATRFLMSKKARNRNDVFYHRREDVYELIPASVIPDDTYFVSCGYADDNFAERIRNNALYGETANWLEDVVIGILDSSLAAQDLLTAIYKKKPLQDDVSFFLYPIVLAELRRLEFTLVVPT